MEGPQTEAEPAAWMTALQQRCAEAQTGYLVLLTARQRSATFQLFHGQIVSCTYAAQTGMDALRLLTQATVQTVTFIAMPTKRVPARGTLSNAQIFQYLSKEADVTLEASPGASGASAGLSTHDQAVLTKTLAAHIGPVAQLLCQRIVGRATTFDAALTALAAEFSDAQQAAAFMHDARAARSRPS